MYIFHNMQYVRHPVTTFSEGKDGKKDKNPEDRERLPRVMFTHKFKDNSLDNAITIIYHKRPLRNYNSLTDEVVLIKDVLFSKFTIAGTFYPLRKRTDEFVGWLAEDHSFLINEGVHVARVASTDFFTDGKRIIRTNPWHLTTQPQDVLTEITYEAVVLKQSGLLNNDDVKQLAKKYVSLQLIPNTQVFLKKFQRIEPIVLSLNSHI